MNPYQTNTYLFVDGSHFSKYFNESTQKWFGREVDFDFKKIKLFFKAEKVFYYDCINDIKNDSETQLEFETRKELQEKKLDRIRDVEGCHVHKVYEIQENKKRESKRK